VSGLTIAILALGVWGIFGTDRRLILLDVDDQPPGVAKAHQEEPAAAGFGDPDHGPPDPGASPDGDRDSQHDDLAANLRAEYGHEKEERESEVDGENGQRAFATNSRPTSVAALPALVAKKTFQSPIPLRIIG
jgi:hypothetical protein